MTKFPKNVRRFAFDLHYLSPRAYEYVRETFEKSLPHSSTIRKWYANSDLNAEPGITNATVKFLSQKVAEKKKNGEELVCSVCFDEMSMRQHITFSQSQGRMLGYASFGSDPDEPEVAKEAIVFVVSGLNERFSIPIAYHFVSKLNAEQKTVLVKEVG